ncbi:MAG TPA: PPE family protein, partial [Mycobacterium sp.]|nr:PPE family protein [Mycobacterium sp.]
VVVKPGAGEANDTVSTIMQSASGLSNILRQLLAFFQDPIGSLMRIIQAFLANPAGALVLYGPLLFFVGYQVFFNIVGWPTWAMILSAPFLLPLLLGIGLSAVTVLPAEIAPVAAGAAGGAPLLASTRSPGWPVASVAPTVASPAGAPASTAAAGAGAAAAPAPAAATGSFAYIVGGGGDPETGFGPTVGGRGGVKAPAATIPAAAAALPSRAEARARRRRRAAMREHGDEYADMDSDIGVPPDYGQADEEQLASAVASGNGAGRLGFAGTADKAADLRASGLTKLAGDEYGGGPRMPMVPGTWDQDTEGPSEPDESGRGG